MEDKAMANNYAKYEVTEAALRNAGYQVIR